MTQSTPVPEAVIEAAYSGEPLDNRPPEAMDGGVNKIDAAHIAKVFEGAKLTKSDVDKLMLKLRELAMQELADQAQELNMGYGSDSGNTKPAP